MTQSVEEYEEIVNNYLNNNYPNDIQNFEKIQYSQSRLDNNPEYYNNNPNLKQAVINVINKLKQENIISNPDPTLDSDPLPDNELSYSPIVSEQIENLNNN